MTKKLPINGFKWIGETSQFTQEFTIIWIWLFFLTVDFDYPSHLHDEHNDLPFLLEKWKIGKTNKLSTNLFNKKNYAIHTASLKQPLDHRLIFNKVHKEIQFDKSNWLHPYIEHNNDLRAKATNEFDKKLYKLINNSFYGKKIESKRVHRDIRLIYDHENLPRLASKPNYDNKKYFDGIYAAEMKKVDILINKPIYVEVSILDISKIRMYEYY